MAARRFAGLRILSAPLLALALVTVAHALQASLLANGGFENAAAGWTRFGNVEIADWAKETGSAGLAMQGWILNGKGGIFQSVPGNPGLTYTFSVRARKEPLFQAAKVYVTLEFFAADNVTKAGHDQGTINAATSLTTEWQTFTIQGTAPLGTVFVRPVIRFEGATSGDLGSGKQSCLWDNASLTVSDF